MANDRGEDRRQWIKFPQSKNTQRRRTVQLMMRRYWPLTTVLHDHANRVRDIDMDKLSFRSAFSVRKWAGYALSLLGLVQQSIYWGWSLLDIGGRLDFLWHIAESAGGTPAMLTTAIFWPWTGIILIASGVLYVVFVGEPTSGVQRHHWWPYVGWGIAGFVFASMAGTALYGAAELYIRSEIAKGIAGVSRGASPAENNQAHPQRPLVSENQVLQPDQIRILKEELPTLRQFINHISIAYTSSDAETLGVAGQYIRLFERSGITASQTTMDPSGPDDEGIIIEVQDQSKIPEVARKLMEILEIANIHTITRGGNIARFGKDLEFILFVAPAHVD